MGLAASQARFLAITARKAQLELQSTQLAQQELSLARDMEQVSEEYQDALNQTTLVWDPDGSQSTLYDLTYSLMMTPSEVNNYLPYMLARRDGKIALNSSYAAAAEAAGIDESGGSGDKEEAFVKFISALQENGTIDYSTYETLVGTYDLDNPVSGSSGYIESAGVGGDLYDRDNGSSVTITSLISYIDTITENAASGVYTRGSDNYALAQTLTADLSDLDLGSTYNDTEDNYNDSDKTEAAAVIINGDYSTDSFTLADLLNEDVTLLVIGEQDFDDTIIAALEKILDVDSDNAFSTLINNDLETWYDAMMGDGAYDELSTTEKTLLTYIDTLAKSMYTLLMPDDPSATDINAFYMAMDELIDTLSMDEDNLGYTRHDGNKVKQSYATYAVNDAEDYNTWVKNGNCYALSLSNLTEAFLTNFVNGMDGYTGDYVIEDKVSNSYYITDDSSYIYQINNDSDEAEEEIYLREFYSIIFNNIWENGWYENEYIDDEDYLQNAIKTGQLFVVSLNSSDNYFYQEKYAMIEGEYIVEQTDSDAIAEAEVEYTVKKDKINAKEEELELEMTQLDAEISSLTTEYDTVKSLISQNIEKTFTLFSN